MIKALAVGRLSIDSSGGGLLRALSAGKILRSLGVDVSFVTTYPSADKSKVIDQFPFFAPAVEENESKAVHYMYAAIAPWVLAHRMKKCLNWIVSNFDRREVDLIIALDGMYNCTALWLKRLWNKPLIIDDIPDGIENLKHPHYLRFNRRIFKEADAVLTMSSAASAFLNVKFRVPMDKIFTVPTTVETEFFNPRLSGVEVKERFGLHGPVVLIAGRLPLSFKIQDLIKISQIVAKKVPDVTFMLVGEQSNSRKNRLLNNNDGRIMQISAQPHSTMPNFIAAATVCPLIYPPNFLGTPHKAFEYMSMGKPLVTTAFPGVSDLLDSQNAEIVSSKNPVSSYANGILKLIQAPEYAERLGKAARAKLMLYAGLERASLIVSSALVKLEKSV